MSRAPALLRLIPIPGLMLAAAATAQQPAPAASPAGPPSIAAPLPPATPPAAAAASPPVQAPSPAPTPDATPPAPATQAAPPSVAVSAAPPVVAAEQVAPVELTGVLGEAVLGPDAAHLGRIVDVLADSQGHLRAVVVDVGGFMGVGNRKVAVAWAALHFAPSDKGPVISILIPADRIKSWAEYIPGRAVAILGATGSTQ
jgi:hypothetical protein